VKPRLLIISNLYPLPWQPQRGMFNMQQFSLLADVFDIRVVVPVSFLEWSSRANDIDDNYQGPERWIIPYFFTPKIFRGFYPLMMRWSLKLKLFSKIKQFDPHYILGSWLYPDGVVAADVANELDIPYLLKAHGSDINVYLDNSARGEKILHACRHARKIIVVSRALKEILMSRGLPDSQIDVLYNGVNGNLFFPHDVEKNMSVKKKILFVGNLKRDKGVMELLAAFERLSRRESCELLIAGSGTMRADMERFTKLHNMDAQVNFLGTLSHDQLPGLMRDATLLVLPSYREGVPNVILEAMASGVPVVATNVGGIPEIVDQGLNGFLVPPRNIEALKAAIDDALIHSWNSEKIVLKSKAFDWRQNILQLKKAIRGSDAA
jgi:glycosyltransferase involved in cell wall biosynthesis